MIFVTVGTQLSFDRLTQAVENWAIQQNYNDIVFQVGSNAYQPRHGQVHDAIDHAVMQGLYEKADVIIGHAGMGTILTSLTQGVPLVIMPRLFSKREHRNDHQLATFNKVKDLQGIFPARDETEINGQINLAMQSDKTQGSITPYASQQLTDYIREKVL